MKEYKCDALVLNAVDYRDYDKLITIYAADFGKRTIILKGCKRPKAKQRFAGQPFFFGEFLIVEGKGYDIVTQVESKKSFSHITYDYDAYLDACTVFKTISNLSLSQECGRQFLLLITYLTVLEQNLQEHSLLTSKFYIELLKILGFDINLEFCINCGTPINKESYLDMSGHYVLCPECRTFHSINLKPSVIECMRTLKSNKFMRLISMNLQKEDILATKSLLEGIFQRILA